VTSKDGDPTGSGLSVRERESVDLLSDAGEGPLSASEWGILLLLSTWNARSELI